MTTAARIFILLARTASLACRKPAALCMLALAAGCAAPVPRPLSPAHILAGQVAPAPAAAIPEPVATPAVEQALPAEPEEHYSVTVSRLEVGDLLFALARDADIDLDLHPAVRGTVTLNATDQTLRQLLDRIAGQVPLHYTLRGRWLVVLPDEPVLHSYRVDYVNMSRDVTGTVSINTQIAATSSAAGTAGSPAPASGNAGNSSSTRIENFARNRFWETLEANIRALLADSSAAQPAAGDAGAGPATAAAPSLVIVNPETGVLTVRATRRQHQRIQSFIDEVARIARRQVLIEATIAEVQLTDNYQQGIDWTAFAGGGRRGGAVLSLNPAGNELSANPPFAFGLGRNRELIDSIRLLQAYGDVKVLSSPKLSVLNNQTALLKVVNNIVYFEIKSDVVANTNTQAVRSFSATPRSVSVGLVMAVTPQISADGHVLLNVRPTISRKVGDAQDPTPELATPNLVPVIQTRELESVMRVASGETAVLGGLMQDEINYRQDTVPGLSSLPLIGRLFAARNETARKSELVVLIRPVVADDDGGQPTAALPAGAIPDRRFLAPSFPAGRPDADSAP
ncbi:pilus (MSHA type) biogenesis protein MshL [Methyloversatilis thermotolerans]|uniref:pilus (MSHA type) biogenesis protein MshL n=1 Tax=Methyloversatilis thermotolerans TaxID=1346290 RepID=UPI00036CB4F8|nr:pilus (MSHA type) biogenesis protein MshL [Methyloversatilis thermotolerans]